RHEINWRTPDSIGEVRMHYEGLGRPLLRPLKPKRSIMYSSTWRRISTLHDRRPDMAPASCGRKVGVTILSPTRIGYFEGKSLNVVESSHEAGSGASAWRRTAKNRMGFVWAPLCLAALSGL